jgi:hypothetical protein
MGAAAFSKRKKYPHQNLNVDAVVQQQQIAIYHDFNMMGLDFNFLFGQFSTLERKKYLPYAPCYS